MRCWNSAEDGQMKNWVVSGESRPAGKNAAPNERETGMKCNTLVIEWIRIFLPLLASLALHRLDPSKMNLMTFLGSYNQVIQYVC